MSESVLIALAANVFQQSMTLMMVTNGFDRLLQTDSDKQADDDRGDVNEKSFRVCEFMDWTAGEHLRHAKYVCVRDDSTVSNGTPGVNQFGAAPLRTGRRVTELSLRYDL